MSARTLIRIAIVTVALAGWTTGRVSAQADTQIRVASANAVVMTRASVRSEVVATPPPGTMLDVLDRDGDWYWILLEPDRNGTRRPGWIRATDLEGGSVEQPAPELVPRPLKAKRPPKVKQDLRADNGQSARDRRAEKAEAEELRRAEKARVAEERRLAKAQAEEEKRLEKAREDFEKAQREYANVAQPTPPK